MSDELNQNDQTQEIDNSPETKAPADPNTVYKADGTPVNLNDIMAKHKRQSQAELRQTKQALTETQQAQARLKELAEGLTGGQVDNPETLLQEMAEMVSKLDSDQEKASKAAKKKDADLQVAQQAAEDYRNRYETSTIERAIRDAAPVGPKAYSPAAQNLIVQNLRNSAKLTEDGKVVFDGGQNEEGDPVVWNASDAVGAMESDVTNFGPLFTATVKAGASGEVMDGMKFDKDGGVDPNDLKDFEKFRQLKRTNPEALERTFGKASGGFGGQFS